MVRVEIADVSSIQSMTRDTVDEDGSGHKVISQTIRCRNAAAASVDCFIESSK